MNAFLKDQILYRGDVQYRVDRKMNSQEVRLECTSSGEMSVHKIFNLLTEYGQGTLLTAAKKKHQLSKGVQNPNPYPRLELLSDASRIETRMRIDYLSQLHALGSFSKSKDDLCEDIATIAKLRKDSRPPHVSTVYRWQKTFSNAQDDVRGLICAFDKKGGKGRGRFHPEVEAVIHEKIETVFLSKRTCSAEEVYDAVFLEIQRINTTRIEREWFTTPSLRTIQRRLAELYAFELAVAKYGLKEAERRFANHLGARATRRILELVEIDHSPVDIMVVDQDRIVLGRPTITVVLDRYSRCVLGYHLSLAGHGVDAVFAALSHALLPKTYLSTRYADLELEWNCFGWFTTVLMDNGAEFHAASVGDALINIGVIAEYAKSRNPNDKPHVERFLKTFNYSFIHKLPGTTLAKVGDRVGFKSEDEACLTLEELDRLVHVWVCSRYHLRPHGGLYGRTPLAVWNESAEAYPPNLKLNKEDLDIEFSNLETSSVQHYGIDLNNSVYVSERLLSMRRMMPVRSKVTVKWPSSDAGYIFVWDSQDCEYFKVPNKDPQFNGLTVAQANIARKAKASGDPSYQQTRSEAGVVFDEIVGNALQDKKLKTRRNAARDANMTSNDSRGTKREAPASFDLEDSIPDVAVDVTDFDIEVELPEQV